MIKDDIYQMLSDDAWLFLESNPHAILVDVRTIEEWNTVGVPDISQLGRKLVFISWLDSAGIINPDFVKQLHEEVSPDQELVFICRGGARSQAAAQAAKSAGFCHVHNIVDGFEGSSSHHDHHGWKDSGLPWRKI